MHNMHKSYEYKAICHYSCICHIVVRAAEYLTANGSFSLDDDRFTYR